MPTKLTAKVKAKLKQLIDPDLARALAHPIRGHILVRLGEVGTMSAAQIAKELGLESSDLSYHFRILRKQRLVGRPQRVKRRGFTEHMYTLADPIMYIDDREWKRIPKEVCKYLDIDLLKSIFGEMVTAANAGTFTDERSHTTRLWVAADEQGHDELMKFEKKVLKDRMALGRKIERRVRQSGGSLVPVTLVSICFRRPAAETSGEGVEEG
ncbi:MAG: helix-turn-helix domain-containing protein [Solirubrobacterales bacterium]